MDMPVPVRVVVVEDDALMQRLLVEWLEAAGYDVRASRRESDTGATQPDVVIADVYMPRCGGRARLADLRARWPAAGLIAISGQVDASGPGAASALGAQRTIAKPFSRESLLSAVRDTAAAMISRRSQA